MYLRSCSELSRVVVLNDPVAGLDSAAALALMRVLQALARRGQTVVAAIHQPRTTVFDAFDHLVLLSKGHAIFDGRPADCVAHLEGVGATVLPPRTNPADWLMDVITADEELPAGERVLPAGWDHARDYRGDVEGNWSGSTGGSWGGSRSGSAVNLVAVGGGGGGGALAAAEAGTAPVSVAEVAVHDTSSAAAAAAAAAAPEQTATVARQLYLLTVREDKSRRGTNMTLINAVQMLIMGGAPRVSPAASPTTWCTGAHNIIHRTIHHIVIPQLF